MSELKPCPFCEGDIEMYPDSAVEGFSEVGHTQDCFMMRVFGFENYEAFKKAWNHRPAENRIKAQAFIAGAEWQEGAQAFDYDIGIDTQREKAAAEYADKLEGEE